MARNGEFLSGVGFSAAYYLSVNIEGFGNFNHSLSGRFVSVDF
jgi:uncharacterized phosphosugar-binding protein